METRKGRHVELPKITRPETSETLLRPRLFGWLEHCSAKIGWIVGPPGAGKTTLVSSFLANSKLRHIWYQLDEGDADPATFFHYLDLALKRQHSRPLPPLAELNPEHRSEPCWFTSRFAELFIARLEPPVLLVLDNYEKVPADAPLHGIVRDLASRLATGFRLAVLSRGAPPPPFAQMRLYGDLTVLDSDALNLNLDEARDLATAKCAVDACSAPDHALVIHLHSLTRGWIAGFRLLLADMRHCETEFGKANCSQSLLFDFFAAELFNRLPVDVQRALSWAALLPCMTVAQAEALTGHPAIGAVLADLQAQNGFVSRHPDSERVYEYHPLFRLFLLERAKVGMTEMAWRELESRATEIIAMVDRPEASADRVVLAPAKESLAKSTGVEGVPAGLLNGEPNAECWPIRVKTLGHFQVLLNGELLRFSGRCPRKPLELLKCLCAFGGDAVNEQRINDALWPDADGDAADQALRTNLHRLRKLLGRDDAIHFEGRQLTLHPQLVWTDCRSFLGVAQRIEETDAEILRDAFAHYQGHFIAGESAPWVFACRENLRAHFLRLAERLGSRLELCGEIEGAVDCYLRTIAIEPSAEHIYRRLMRTHIQLGQPAMAVAAYQRCRLALHTQLGLSPSRETEALYRSVVGE